MTIYPNDDSGTTQKILSKALKYSVLQKDKLKVLRALCSGLIFPIMKAMEVRVQNDINYEK